MKVPAHLLGFWNDFRRAAGGVDEARFYEAFCFGDSEALANGLAVLVLQGAKRATAASVWAFEAEARNMPRPGDLSIVTNWAIEPLCVIQTRAIDIVRFADVSAEFAALEGEGDGSLAFWQESHQAYFTRECERIGRQFSEDMPVACKRFEVVYRGTTFGNAHV